MELESESGALFEPFVEPVVAAAVAPPLVSLRVDGANALTRLVLVGATRDGFEAVVSGDVDSVVWSVDDPSIARVVSNGLFASVIGVKEGTTTLRVSVSNQVGTASDTSFITVYSNVGVQTPDTVVLAGARMHRGGSAATIFRGTLPVDTKATFLSFSADWVRVQFPDSFVFPTDDAHPDRWVWVLKSSVHIPPMSVTVSPASASVNVGGTVALQGSFMQPYANDVKLSWTSSNTAVASVSATGVVTGRSAGSATVMLMGVSSHGVQVSSSATVQVMAVNVPVSGVSLKPATASINVGGTVSLTPTVTPANATNKNLTWSSSNTSVATVSAGGVVTGRAAGNATITVKTVDGGKTATVQVKVSVPVVGVKLSSSALTLKVGAKSTLTPTITPASASNKGVSWSSSNTSVATVDAKGVVTGKKAGTVNITVKTVDGGKTAVAKVTVKAGLAISGVKPVPSVLPVGQIVNVSGTITSGFTIGTVTGQILDSTGKAVYSFSESVGKTKYTPSNTMNIKMAFSKLTKPGSYTYTITASDVSPETKQLYRQSFTLVTPVVKVSGVKLDKTIVNIKTGASTTLTATITPANATNKNLSWASSNKTVATVNTKGVVTGIKQGTAQITATTADGSKQAKATVNVTPATATTSTLAVTGVNTVPNPLAKGKPVTVTGTVSSNYKLASVTAKITTRGGGTVICGTTNPCSRTVTSTGATFNLNVWDSALKFSQLPTGDYKYTVTATDITKNQATKTINFTVKTAATTVQTNKPPVTPTTAPVIGAPSWAPKGLTFPLAITKQSQLNQSYFTKEQSYHGKVCPGYWAVDLMVKAGTPVLAAYEGVVIDVKISNDSFGSSVQIWDSKNSIDYFYTHMKTAIQVKKNQPVKAGTVIGYVKSGTPGGPHLHIDASTARVRPRVAASLGTCPTKDWLKKYEFKGDLGTQLQNLYKKLPK
ncbi:MAG: Ig-like domain-containing protein [Propionibacteriaceae bacterium]|nr:Ig-like domain-containing protein [Propionibacteriaceae bacterium]